VRPYWLRVLIAIDQLVNTILGGNEDETISSRVGRHAVAGDRWALAAEVVIDAVLGTGHCRRAIEPRLFDSEAERGLLLDTDPSCTF
jgi:hypothetical protein